MPSSRALIWKKFAPWVTVLPVLKSARGIPACSAASSRATPLGSAGGTLRSRTGPSWPWWAPGSSLFSSFWYSRNASSEFQPCAPCFDSHSSRSSDGAQNAMHELWDEHPPSTLARAMRMKELPFSCSSSG